MIGRGLIAAGITALGAVILLAALPVDVGLGVSHGDRSYTASTQNLETVGSIWLDNVPWLLVAVLLAVTANWRTTNPPSASERFGASIVLPAFCVLAALAWVADFDAIARHYAISRLRLFEAAAWHTLLEFAAYLWPLGLWLKAVRANRRVEGWELVIVGLASAGLLAVAAAVETFLTPSLVQDFFGKA